MRITYMYVTQKEINSRIEYLITIIQIRYMEQ